MRMRCGEQEQGNVELRRNLIFQMFRDDAAEIERDNRDAAPATLKHQRFCV